MVETGFHSAKYCRARGIPVVGAKAFDKKVSGKVTIKLTFCTTRASDAESPTRTPTHESAYPKQSKKINPRAMLPIPLEGRHPTT